MDTDQNFINTFVESQKELLNLEKSDEIEQYQQLLKESTVKDLEQSGICLSKLVVDKVKTGLYGKILYSLRASNYDKQALAENESLRKKMTEKFSQHRFSPGDAVGLYEFRENKGPDFNSKPLLQGVVYRVKEFNVIVSVNDSSVDSNYEQSMFYLIVMTNEVTYKRYFEALDKIVEVKNSQNYQSEHLVRVLLENRDPGMENPYFKRADLKDLLYKDVKFQDSTLNEDQKEAIYKSLKAQSLFLIHGPPGTGKTKTLCEFIYQCTLRKLRVLACAASNIAVDNMTERLLRKNVKCCRLGHPARLLPGVLESCLDHLVSKDSSRKDLRANKKEINKLLRQLSKTTDRIARKDLYRSISGYEKEIRTLERGAIQDTLTNAEVIFCTNTGAGDRSLRAFIENIPGKAFDILAIDECAQALEVSCWIPLCFAKKVILAGDHLQLPPTIKSKEADKKGLNVTLFDRLMKKFEKDYSQMLRTQYRMNKKIMEWSSKEVYQGKLIADQSVENHNLFDLRDRKDEKDEAKVLEIIDTAGCQMGENVSQGEGQSKFNVGEADIVRVIMNELIQEYRLEPQDIGIITPYNAQVDLIRREIQKDDSLKGVECSTVDGFQGREKEVVIISMVRSNPIGNVGFLGEFRRMNVAVTRAKRYVAIICDTDTVKHDDFLKRLVDYFEANGEVRTAKEFQLDKSVRFGEGFIAKSDAKEKETPNDQDNKNQSESKAKKKNKKKKEPQQVNAEKVEPVNSKVNDSHSTFPSVAKTDFSQIMRDIDDFFANPLQNELRLPSTLENFERRQVHEYAEKVNLIHESVGEGLDRRIILKKEN